MRVKMKKGWLRHGKNLRHTLGRSISNLKMTQERGGMYFLILLKRLTYPYQANSDAGNVGQMMKTSNARWFVVVTLLGKALTKLFLMVWKFWRFKWSLPIQRMRVIREWKCIVYHISIVFLKKYTFEKIWKTKRFYSKILDII